MSCYLLICENYSLTQIENAFGRSYLSGLMTYRDAGIGPDDFPITVRDCLVAIQKAINAGWYDFNSFSSQKFEKMQKNGDLSWIVPNMIIAFPSPVTAGYGRVTAANNCSPKDFLPGFREANVGGVIRLNDKLYDYKPFEREGITVHGLEFPDGSNPSDHIIGRFVQMVD